MVNVHSKAFELFVKNVNASDYRQGYDPLLLKKIFETEREEIEQLIIKFFNTGDWNLGIFLPELQNYNGIEHLEKAIGNLKVGCSAYLDLVPIAYNATKDRAYLDTITALLEDDKDEDERLDIVVCLSNFEKSDVLYSIFKKICLFDEDKFVRSQATIGMLYCKGIVERAGGIHNLPENWKTVKQSMCEANKDVRELAIKQFEQQFL